VEDADNMAGKEWGDATLITVRDRREPRQFSVHNRLIDEWLPIIGVNGLVLYAFYVRLSNRVDERAFPGFKLINRHFGFSRQTIWLYNRLLVWCDLIHIEAGDRRRSNDYYILPTPRCDEDALLRIGRRVAGGLDEKVEYQARFRRLVMERIGDWCSIQELWAKPGPKVVVTRAQMEMDLRGGSEGGEGEIGVKGVVQPVNYPSSASEPQRFTGRTTEVQPVNYGGSASEPEQSEDNNPKVQSEDNSSVVVGPYSLDLLFKCLKKRGLGIEKSRELVARFGARRVAQQMDWLSYRVDGYLVSGKEVRNPAGLLIRAIEEDWVKPEGGMVGWGDEAA